MSGSSPQLPARPSLERLRKQAKQLLHAYRAADPAVRARFRAVIDRLADPDLAEDVRLADAQFMLAREYGFESWPKLVRHVERLRPPALERHERLAHDLVAAYRSGDAGAIRRLGEQFGRSLDAALVQEYVNQRLAALPDAERRAADFGPDDARLLVARLYGFADWAALAESSSQPPGDPRKARHGISATPPFYRIDWQRGTIEPRQPMSASDWDVLFGVIEELHLTGLNANGQMSDDALAGLAALAHVTHLDLSGCRRLTDRGLRHLARMRQLRHLNLSDVARSPITDRGLEALRELTELRTFEMGWRRGISDAGVANLAGCDRLESVDLMGTPTGDGAIEALAGKPALRRLKTGRRVTDAALPRLHEFPVFRRWHGGEPEYSLMSADAGPNHLMLDGPITDRGMGALAGLDGLFGLSLFWHLGPGLTPAGLAVLGGLPRLGFLGCEGALCNDEAMRHIAAIPRLRMLMAQGAVASDDGFATLSRSQTIEYIWGRECPNLRSRGFAALASMPALKGLAVSCKKVDDAALATLPDFPSLTQLMPMDVPDEGFRHVGRCARLEALWCMYCRDTTDIATGHIAGLALETYYAGRTRITDGSLELLGRMASLESIELWQIARISSAGVAHLARLPRLRQITIDGSPGVTREALDVFPAGVRVSYSP